MEEGPERADERRDARRVSIDEEDEAEASHKTMRKKRRIAKEVTKLENLPEGITAAQDRDDYRIIHFTVIGLPNSPFAGGGYHGLLTVPEEYPMAPPTVRLETKIFNPHVDSDGLVCADFLGAYWQPAITIDMVLVMVQSLLLSPSWEIHHASRLDCLTYPRVCSPFVWEGISADEAGEVAFEHALEHAWDDGGEPWTTEEL